jgi:periplasmic divalent cation tolerance protein
MAAVTLYSTWPDLESAEKAARALVDQRLAACANLLPGSRSIYRWQDETHVDPEVVMFAKTTTERAESARDLLLSRHPYDLPCVVAINLAATGSNGAFMAWIEAQTA